MSAASKQTFEDRVEIMSRSEMTLMSDSVAIFSADMAMKSDSITIFSANMAMKSHSGACWAAPDPCE